MRAEFDHEKLDVYRLSIAFVSWLSELLERAPRTSRPSALKHLDEASTSVALNIAEGNGKRSLIDRARFLDIARGSALEAAACLDVLVARGRLRANEIAVGKELLVRVVSMLTRLIERLAGSLEPSTSTSTTKQR